MDLEIGVPVKVTDKNSWGVPNIQFTDNLTSFGNATSSPFQIDDKVFQGVDNFSWIIGKHLLRMGGEYRYNLFPQLGNEFPRPVLLQRPVHQLGEPHRQTGGYRARTF